MATYDIIVQFVSEGFFHQSNSGAVIADDPQGYNFKFQISKVPRGNSYYVGSIIDIKKRLRYALRVPIRLRMAQTRPFSHYQFAQKRDVSGDLFWRLKLVILETKWNRLEIFCYGDRSHIRVQLHMKYYLGAAKLVVTGGKNVIFWHFRRQNQTIPLRLPNGPKTYKIG